MISTNMFSIPEDNMKVYMCIETENWYQWRGDAASARYSNQVNSPLWRTGRKGPGSDYYL